jgi:hypothetical protein
LCLLMIFLAAALYLINISPEAEPPVIGPPTPTETATPANFHGIGETAGPLTTDPEDKATPASEASPSADPITESTPDPSLPADLPSVTPSETISPTPTATPVPTPDPNAAPFIHLLPHLLLRQNHPHPLRLPQYLRQIRPNRLSGPPAMGYRAASPKPCAPLLQEATK